MLKTKYQHYLSTVGPSLPWATQSLCPQMGLREVGWKRGLGFHFWKEREVQRGPDRDSPSCSQQAHWLLGCLLRSSSSFLAPLAYQPPVSTPLPSDFLSTGSTSAGELSF